MNFKSVLVKLAEGSLRLLECWGCLWEISGFGFSFFWTILNINHNSPQGDLIIGESITTKDVESHLKP